MLQLRSTSSDRFAKFAILAQQQSDFQLPALDRNNRSLALSHHKYGAQILSRLTTGTRRLLNDLDDADFFVDYCRSHFPVCITGTVFGIWASSGITGKVMS